MWSTRRGGSVGTWRKWGYSIFQWGSKLGGHPTEVEHFQNFGHNWAYAQNFEYFPLLSDVSHFCWMSLLPTKIESALDGFTADEWKNSTLIFSIYALKSILPSSHQECYRYFVIACQYICNRTINTNNLHIADSYLMSFVKDLKSCMDQKKSHLTCIPWASQGLYYGYGASLWILAVFVWTVSSNFNLFLVF